MSRSKKIIEWHFKNHKSDVEIGGEQVCELAERGLIPSYSGVRVMTNKISDPTGEIAVLLCGRAKEYLWAKVIEYTVAAFRFDKADEIITKRYFERKGINRIMSETGMPERTIYYHIDRVLAYAEQWAYEYGLLNFR